MSNNPVVTHRCQVSFSEVEILNLIAEKYPALKGKLVPKIRAGADSSVMMTWEEHQEIKAI